jgi:S1-C subfamily serine protease
MTAKHVVDGCGRVFVRNGQNWERAAVAFEDAETDTAIIGARGGVPMLPVTAGPFGLGEDGFAFGFAGQGGPSAIHAVLLGRARAVQGGRFAGSTPVLAWAERDWQPPGERWIGGMSGGPLTTAEGAVAGIMSVASQRRGRIYTVAPEVIARVMRDRLYAFVPPGAAPVAATGENFDGVRSVLMGRRSVVQVLCAG